MKIGKESDLQTIESIVCECLKLHDIEARLTDGDIVSIYPHNEYQSYDLDFITHSSV